MALLTTIATVGTLAAEFGPSVLRGIGSLFGGKAKDVAEDIADGVETIEKAFKDPAQKQQKIESLLADLPPEALVELEKIKVELEREKNRRVELENEGNARAFEHTETVFSEGQRTIRSGDNAKDPKVAACRPNLSYISLISTALYVLMMSVLNALGKGTGPDMVVASILIGPAACYMGMRWDEKKRGIAS
ncbi:hypothetical protein [Grimontia hollisae]|uniref:hypothetical protein n=1 Tax=Grimontia hollisae TaxID=673 RepID=UPI0012AD1E86|nr:hypothetical protein [Grimontia hollisae]